MCWSPCLVSHSWDSISKCWFPSQVDPWNSKIINWNWNWTCVQSCWCVESFLMLPIKTCWPVDNSPILLINTTLQCCWLQVENLDRITKILIFVPLWICRLMLELTHDNNGVLLCFVRLGCLCFYGMYVGSGCGRQLVLHREESCKGLGFNSPAS